MTSWVILKKSGRLHRVYDRSVVLDRYTRLRVVFLTTNEQQQEAQHSQIWSWEALSLASGQETKHMCWIYPIPLHCMQPWMQQILQSNPKSTIVPRSLTISIHTKIDLASSSSVWQLGELGSCEFKLCLYGSVTVHFIPYMFKDSFESLFQEQQKIASCGGGGKLCIENALLSTTTIPSYILQTTQLQAGDFLRIPSGCWHSTRLICDSNSRAKEIALIETMQLIDPLDINSQIENQKCLSSLEQANSMQYNFQLDRLNRLKGFLAIPILK